MDILRASCSTWLGLDLDPEPEFAGRPQASKFWFLFLWDATRTSAIDLRRSLKRASQKDVNARTSKARGRFRLSQEARLFVLAVFAQMARRKLFGNTAANWPWRG